jgi:hypothetical protein
VLCTVSTVKDSRPNIARFVERNLASGADHMFVFLEADEDDTLVFLTEHPHVTPVRTDAGYWHDAEPANLNIRQAVNANVANTVLAVVGCAQWLVHIDGDECLDLDRDRLAALPDEVRCVRLDPLESVSQRQWDGEVTRFKRRLDFADLSLLTSLGVIPSPANAAYFRGHVHGKPGVRPALDLSLTVHRARTRDGHAVEHLGGDFLQLLHYESYSGEEFVRKWQAHLSSGKGAGFKPSRNVVKSAVHALQRNEHLTPEARQDYLWRIYERHVADPVDLLEDLGLLVTPRPELHDRQPAGLPADDAALLDTLLALLVAADKDPFTGRGPADGVVRLLRQIRDELGAERPGGGEQPGQSERGALSARLDAALAATEPPAVPPAVPSAGPPARPPAEPEDQSPSGKGVDVAADPGDEPVVDETG